MVGIEDKLDMDKLTTEMMEHICDNICKHPNEAEDQDELEDICAECEMGRFVCDILNMHNKMQQASEKGGMQNAGKIIN